MQIILSHQNSYSYHSEIFLDPQTIRLYPRLSPFVSIVNETIDISPKPTMLSKNIDSEGNTILQAWFNQKTNQFTVNTKFLINVKQNPPFEFFVNPTDLKFPFEYENPEKKGLNIYIEENEKLCEELVTVAKNLQLASKGNLIDFLVLLADYIYKNYKYEIRENGNPHSANETFQQKQGSCRDFSVLYMAISRYFKLATRYVSGYKLNNKENEYHLHSWVEVYIPGGGWRGIDPSIGLFIDADYIALCASFLPKNTAPIYGFTRGECKNVDFKYKIDIQRAEQVIS